MGTQTDRHTKSHSELVYFAMLQCRGLSTGRESGLYFSELFGDDSWIVLLEDLTSFGLVVVRTTM